MTDLTDRSPEYLDGYHAAMREMVEACNTVANQASASIEKTGAPFIRQPLDRRKVSAQAKRETAIGLARFAFGRGNEAFTIKRGKP